MTERLLPTTTSVHRSGMRSCAQRRVGLAASAILILAFPLLSAQTPANVPAAQGAPAVSSHRKSSPAHAAVPAPAVETPTPLAPETPKWPMNDAPAPPAIRWDSHGLQVAAKNSSLRRIMDEVATTTGTRVEGLGPDERVFGDYGPGPARDVISQILNGSSYNVLMLGDQGQGTPREIILSEKTKAGGSPSGQASNHQPAQDEDAEQQPEAEEPIQQMPLNRLPMNQPMNQPMTQPVPLNPQQRMMDMQRQQMQQQQMQQQQQQQNQDQPVELPPQPQD